MTALGLAVMSGWELGMDELLAAGADPELRYFRTGETPLNLAVLTKNESCIARLLDAGANPDAANYWGVTPRVRSSHLGLSTPFDRIPAGEVRLPPPRIQDAEHLADHHHPIFKIPKRAERESLEIGQAVDLYVYGPRSEAKQDTVKVRINARTGQDAEVRYCANLETPVERTHLGQGTTVVEFGPEHIASVYVPRPRRKKAE